MDFKIPDSVELDIRPKTEVETFKFSTRFVVRASRTKGKTEWELDIEPIVPKRPGRPKKEPREANFKLVKACDLASLWRLDDASQFLKQALKDGTRLSRDIFTEAVANKLSRKSVYRAAKMLDVIKRPEGVGKNRPWAWELRYDKSTELAQHAEGSESDLDPPRS